MSTECKRLEAACRNRRIKLVSDTSEELIDLFMELDQLVDECQWDYYDESEGEGLVELT